MTQAMRRVMSMVVKDLRLIRRNHYLTIVLGLAVLYAVSVRFLIPADVSPKPTIVLQDMTEHGVLSQALSADDAGRGNLITVTSGEQFDSAMSAMNRLGLKATGAGGAVEQIEVVYQGHENARVRRLLEASLRAVTVGINGQPLPEFSQRTLNPHSAAQTPPFNMAMVPVLVFSEAALVGMFLAATLLFSEKEERSLRAFRVTPATVVEYMGARAIAMGLLGLAFTIPMTLLTVGWQVQWGAILGVVFVSGLVMTLVSLVVANMFAAVSQFVFAALALVVVLSLPTVSYFLPGFSPGALRFLPTYPLIFALREAYFPTGDPGVLRTAFVQLGLTLAVVFPLAVVTFRRQLVVRDV